MFWRELLNRLGTKVWSPDRLAQYATSLILIVVILVVAILVYQALSRAMRRLFRRKTGLLREGRRRTLVPLANSILKYLIGFIALIMVLHQLGVNYTAILAGAGVVGIAVGFGAQTLVRDFISGFFILFEGLIEVGDFIEVGDKSGTVEEIGLRSTQFRAFNGVLHTIPNGELARFGNYNRGYMRAIVDVQLAYEQDVQKGMARAAEVAQQWASEHTELVIEPPQVLGVFDFTDSGMTIKVAVKVKPQTHWQVERELRCRLKEAFDSSGIEIPLPGQVVHVQGRK